MPDPPPEVAAYLAACPDKHREALLQLRQTILAAAPTATERISYKMPAFFVDGRSVACIASFTNHCSFFSGYLAAEIGRTYPGVDVVASTVRFTPEKPLPVALVKEVVREQVERIRAKAAQTKGKKTSTAKKTGAAMRTSPPKKPSKAKAATKGKRTTKARATNKAKKTGNPKQTLRPPGH